MNSLERGFLLLSSHLGNPDRKVLTGPQLRVLAQRITAAQRPEVERELEEKDLVALGYGNDFARRIVELLSEEAELEYYLRRGRHLGCTPVTRVSPGYPGLLRQRLGTDAPGCLWIRGTLPDNFAGGIALVGSRELEPPNRAFAEKVGQMAAEQGTVLISGNARGADRTAQDACLARGGRVISVVADQLTRQPMQEGICYLSEDGFEEGFSAQRALSRNRVIHALGRIVFVAQCGYGSGGTWDGTTRNLRHGWSTVACFRDGSDAARELEQMGAFSIGMEELKDFSVPPTDEGFLNG